MHSFSRARLLGAIALIALDAWSAPSSPAGKYSWPLQISLPLSIGIPNSVANVMDGLGNVTVACTDTPATGAQAGKTINLEVSPSRVPTSRAPGADISYDKTMTLVLTGPGTPNPGDVIACKL